MNVIREEAKLRQQNLSQEEYKSAYQELILESIVAWVQEDPDRPRTDEEEFLWLWLMVDAGVPYSNFQELIMRGVEQD